MKNQKGLGNYLKQARQKKKLTIAEVELQTGISNSHLSLIENEKSSPSLEKLRILADLYQLDFKFLLYKAGVLVEKELGDLDQNDANKNIPLISLAIPGKTVYEGLDSFTENYVLLNKQILEYYLGCQYREDIRYYLLRVNDNSMADTIQKDDVVLLSPDVPTKNGDIALVHVNLCGICLRRVFFQDGLVLLGTDKRTIKPLITKREVLHVLAKAVFFTRSFKDNLFEESGTDCYLGNNV